MGAQKTLNCIKESVTGVEGCARWLRVSSPSHHRMPPAGKTGVEDAAGGSIKTKFLKKKKKRIKQKKLMLQFDKAGGRAHRH